MVECKRAQPKETMMSQTVARALPGYSYISTPSIGIPAAAAAAADVAAANSHTGYYTEYCPTATTAIPAGSCQQQMASGHHLAPTALGIIGLPRTEANTLSAVGATSPVHHREQYLIQRTIQSNNGPVTLQTITSQNQGLLSLQDYSTGGALSMMNGYTSTYAAQVSPPSASGFPQINSPTTVDVYGTNGLGYIRAASPQPLAFAVGGTMLSAAFQNGMH